MKVRFLKKAAVAACAAVLAGSLTACGGTAEPSEEISSDLSGTASAVSYSEIAGSWEHTDVQDVGFQFNEDGTGTHYGGRSFDAFTYEIDGSTIICRLRGSSTVNTMEFELQGDTLRIWDSSGEENIYRRS